MCIDFGNCDNVTIKNKGKTNRRIPDSFLREYVAQNKQKTVRNIPSENVILASRAYRHSSPNKFSRYSYV